MPSLALITKPWELSSNKHLEPYLANDVDKREPGVGQHDALQLGAVEADNGGDVVVGLLRQRQHLQLVQELEDVSQKVGRDGGRVGQLLQVELLDLGALVEATNCRRTKTKANKVAQWTIPAFQRVTIFKRRNIAALSIFTSNFVCK